jgi:phosphonatase-like hydrolase
MTLPELVVFDMAGTTVFDGDAVNGCLAAALSAAGVSTTRDEINAVMGLPKPIAIQQVLESHNVSEELDAEAIHSEFVSRMLAFYLEDPSVREVPGTTRLFLALKLHHVKVALDTGFSRDIASAILERLGWNRNDLLDATVTSDEVENGRPYPDLIYRAMELTDTADASNVMKVGDTPSDLLEGTNAGCGWVVGVTNGSHSVEELECYPHTHLLPDVTHLHTLLGIPVKSAATAP